MTWMLLILILSQSPDAASQQGTAVVRGRITDAQTGAGLSDALVTLYSGNSAQRRETLANPDGYYEFSQLPGGPVSVSATAGEHRATHVAGDFLAETPAGGRTRVIALREGQVREGIDIALARSLAIGGRVVDDAGAPLARLRVQVFRAPGGQAVAGRGRETDDRGAFRLFGLAPGRYFVCAELSVTHMFAPLAGGDRRREPVPACHRSTAGDEMGTPITLARADVEGVEIVAPRRPTLTVSGVVLDADGNPASVSVSVMFIRRTGASGSTKRADDGGRFTVTDLAPGAYRLSATTMSGGPSGLGSDPQYVEMELALDVDDVTDLILTMRRPAQVKGRVVFDSGRPPDGGSGLAVRAEASLRGLDSATQAPRPVDADFRFELVNLFGPQVVTVSNLPRGWIVKAVRYRDVDVTDLPTAFRTGPDEIEIELTTRGAVLTGTVRDGAGNPASTGRVLMFPADPARRRPDTWRGAVIVRDGRFTLPPRRAGDYLIAALSEGDYDGLGHTPAYELLEKVADRVTLLDDDRRVMELRLAALPSEDVRR
jgi:hypothetical protein